MAAAPEPPDEAARLQALRDLEILDTPIDSSFDDLTRLAAAICGTPISAVSLIDADRQWFKSIVGLDVQETPRDLAFCAHAILDSDVFVVNDATKDHRFVSNSLVTDDPNIRFYAGAPLEAPGGERVGTLCVIDREPRELTEDQALALEALGRVASRELASHRQAIELADVRNQFEAAFEHAPVGMSMMGPDGRFERVNPAFAALVGRQPDDLKGASFEEVTHPADREMDRQSQLAFSASDEEVTIEKRYLKPDGTVVWASVHRSAVRRPDGTFRHWVTQIVDITERRRQEAVLAYQATHDALTDLGNRDLLNDHLELAAARTRRTKVPFGVLFLDLDGFKAVNDTHGHAAGDAILTEAAERIRGVCRDTDTPARLGGDEFVVLCEEIGRPDLLHEIAARLEEAVSEPYEVGGNTITVGASVGRAFSTDSQVAADVVQAADADMYCRKAARAKA